jgi:hypothetical protein
MEVCVFLLFNQSINLGQRESDTAEMPVCKPELGVWTVSLSLIIIVNDSLGSNTYRCKSIDSARISGIVGSRSDRQGGN